MKPWLLIIFLSLAAQAQQTSDAKAKAMAPPAGALTLENYIEQVKASNPEARSLVEGVNQAQLALDEAEVTLSSEFYTNYNYIDDKNEPPISFQGARAKKIGFKSGVRDTTTFGLSSDVFFETQHMQSLGVPNIGIPIATEYQDSRVGFELRQSLWRNGFGSFTRASVDMQRSLSRKELLNRKFALKNLILKSENAYWNMVSLNNIVKLQEENVERAKKLSDWMRKRVGLRLVDDVDGLQAQAALETRDLELQISLDERSRLARQFNTLRGSTDDKVEPLAELPTAENILARTQDNKQRMSREDFKLIFEQAEADLAKARGAESQIAPQLDLTLGAYSNGLDSSAAASYEELQRANNPTIAVGVMFSIPLDYSLIGNMRQSFKAAKRAASSAKENAVFAEDRAWHDLMLQKTEAQKRFARAISLERVQTDLVKRERNRLMNGRTTTFQAVTFEQNLALAQIQKVKSQLDLLQIFNVLKTWEGQP